MPIFPQKSVIAEESPWFKGKDVATSLDYTNPRKALLDHIDEDDKKILRNQISAQEEQCINKGGVSGLSTLPKVA